MPTTPERDYFPILVSLKNQPCCVIGGGRVAYRKVTSLLQAGAKVTVISPETVAELDQLAYTGQIVLHQRTYQPGDLTGCRLAFAATNQQEVNKACRREATETGVFLNVVDVPDLCDFIMPAVHQQGDLLFMVCSQGKSPMLSKRIRKELEKAYGPSYGWAAHILGDIRLQAFQDLPDIRQRKDLFKHLIEEGPLDEALETNEKKAKAILWGAYDKKVATLQGTKKT